MKALGAGLAICMISVLTGCGASGSASSAGSAPHNSMGSYTLAACSDGGGLKPSTITATFTNTTSSPEDVLITLRDANGFLLTEVGSSGGDYTDTPDVHVRPGGSFSQVLYIPNEPDLCESNPYVSDTTK